MGERTVNLNIPILYFFRTLEYLIQHLARVASHSSNTGMTPRNIAIVWAPNLLRSKDLEKGGVAALQVCKFLPRTCQNIIIIYIFYFNFTY